VRDCETLVYPNLGDDAPVGLTRSRIRDWLKLVTAERSKGQARSAFTLLRAACNYAVSQELYPDFTQSPCDKISVSDIGDFPARQVLLTPQQLGAYWLTCGELEELWCTYWRTLLLSAQRRSDIGNARYRELDLERRTLTIPSIRYKTGVLHVLPLTPTMEKILKSRPHGDGNHDHL
jgi:integrase